MLLGPADESALFGTADRARAFRSTLQNTITPQMAVDIATMSAIHPTMSHAVVLGLVTSGITAESEEAAAVSMEEHNAGMDGFRDVLEEWVVNPVEGVVRTGLTGLMSAWEETIPTALRTGVDLYQDAQAGRDVNVFDSYQDAGGGQSAGVRALGMIGSGERINLGSSMIPQSQVANRGLVNEAVEGFGTVQSAFDQYSAQDQLAQSQMGAPLTDLARESALRVHLTHEGGKQAGVSLGSLAMISVAEPGSIAYNVGSTMIDALSQFSKFGDPAILAATGLRNVARSAHSVKMATGGQGLLLSGMRHSVDTGGVPNFLNKGRGRYAVEMFRQATTPAQLDSILKYNKKGSIPIEMRHALLEANTTEETIQALMPYLGVVVDRVYVPGVNTNILGRMVGMRVETASRRAGFKGTMNQQWGNSYLQRSLAEHPDRIIDITDVDKAYGQIQQLGVQMGLGDAAMERHLRRFVSLDRHSVDLANEGYDILKGMMLDVNELVMRDLQRAGKLTAETKSMAKYTTQLFKEVGDESIYWLNDAGDVVKNFDAGGSLMLNEAGVAIGGPQLFSELFRGTIVTPDLTQVRRMMAESGAVKSWFNRGTSTLTDGIYHDRAWLRVTDAAMSSIWKPLALLRLSWPVKIIAEEQMRMAAAGYQSTFHPLTLFSMAIGRKTLGFTDESVVGAFALSEDFMKASARRSDYMSEVVGGGARQWRRIAKGETGYNDGWFTELNQLWSDPLARRVTRDGITDEFVSELLRVGDGMTDDARAYQQIIRAQPEAARDGWNTADGAWRYLESVQARAHQKTGGYWKRIVPNQDGTGGTIYDELGQNVGTVNHPVPREYYEFGGGDTELLQVIATGKYGDFDVARDFSSIRPEDVHDYMTEGMSKSKARRPPDELVKDYVTKDLLGRKVNQQPAYVKGTYQTQDPSMQNKVVQRLFDQFMGNPTTKLSRNPTFKQAYWKKIEEMLPYLDDDVATAIRIQGRNAGATLKSKKVVGASGRSGMTLEQADSYAKAYALTEVEDLLYSASRKTNLADAMRIIMPFAEAHKEVITTWAKIFARNPGITHRTNRFVQAGRTGGYFEPGEDGQEKFYWSDLSKDFLPFDPIGNLESAVSGIDAEGGMGQMAPRLAGNLMGMPPFDFIRNGPVPGLGPIAQAVAGKMIPDKPEFDWVRNTIIGPYQSPEIGTVSAFMPSYMKRLYSAMSGLAGSEGSFGMEPAWQSAQKDVLRSMMASGDWDEPRTQEEFNNMVDEANVYTSKQFFIRALGQFVLPSISSQDYRFEKWDDEARDHVTYVELAKEYQNILAGKRGNEQEAWAEFQRLFGTDPTPWLTSKSYGVRPSPATTDASDWKRRNGDLFEKYPDVAYFMMPDDADAEFDIDAWWRSVQDGSRIVYTGDQWLKQHNNVVGRMAYHQMNLQFKNADGIMKMVRSTLIGKYPGYMEDIAGLPMKASRTEQRRQLQELARDPDLPEDQRGLAHAIQVYLAMEANVNSAARANGVASVYSAKSQLGARNQLRQLAMNLGARVPEFMAVYSQVFARDLKDDNALEPVDLYGGLNPWKDSQMRKGNF